MDAQTEKSFLKQPKVFLCSKKPAKCNMTTRRNVRYSLPPFDDDDPNSVHAMEIDHREEEDTSKRVQVRFVTKLKPPFKVPPTSFAIPADVTRLCLSKLVNQLLQNADADWEHEVFDFMIDGELVRMSLEQFLLAKGISAEKVIEIEYIRAVTPRKEEESSLHDDWVSTVDGSNPKLILTGCYDGFVRVWKEAGSCSHVLTGHSDAINFVCIVNQEGSYNTVVASASKDRTLRLWKIDPEVSHISPTNVRAYKILRGHNAAVQSVCAQDTGDMICSGAWDSTIKLWRTYDFTSIDDAVTIKKRKGNNNHVEESLIEEEPVSVLLGHTQCVSSVVWSQKETIYSASWDHSIKKWDVEMGKDMLSIFSGKALSCLDIGGESSAIIAAGGSDPTLRLWDPRKPASLAPVLQLSSHSSLISACKWHDKSWFHLVSASYDGKIMLWDIRTARPLAVITSHTDKVLCADWWRGDSIISGGADSKLCISSGIPV